MKSNILLLTWLMAGFLRANDVAQVVGPIVDGTPPPPTQPPQKLEIAPNDVIQSVERNLGERKITIRQVAPIELPKPLNSPAASELSEDQREAIRARFRQMKPNVFVSMSVTTFLSANYSGGVRTQFRWWSENREKEFEAWSNIDGRWLSGFANLESGGQRYTLLLGVGSQDVDRWTSAMAAKGREYQPPPIPELPSTEPSFEVTKGNPDAGELAAIKSIHDLVKFDAEKLRLAYEGRARAQAEQEAYAKAHPVKPHDIVLNYWRVEKSQQQEGGAR